MESIYINKKESLNWDLKRKYDISLHSELSFDEKVKLDTQLAKLEIIGNIYENPELLNVK